MEVKSDQILATNLKMLLLDVDGVLTDGGITLIGLNMEAKRFDVQDGVGIALAKASGMNIGIITGRKSRVVERRARELGIEDLCQGVSKKVESLEWLLQKHTLHQGEVAYIGDDIPDLAVMKRVGFPIAVQNAVSEVKECSKYVTQTPGGQGAVREAVDWLLELRGQKAEVYENFIN